MTDDSPASEWPPHIIALYQESTTQLRFMKRQQWAITNYLIAILAGIFAVSKVTDCIAVWGKCAEEIIIVAAPAIAIFLLVFIECQMTRPRTRQADIHRLYSTGKERRELGLRTKPTHWGWDLPFLISLGLVCIVGAIIVWHAVTVSEPRPAYVCWA